MKLYLKKNTFMNHVDSCMHECDVENCITELSDVIGGVASPLFKRNINTCKSTVSDDTCIGLLLSVMINVGYFTRHYMCIDMIHRMLIKLIWCKNVLIIKHVCVRQSLTMISVRQIT